MAGRFDGAALEGLSAARAAFRALPDVTRERLNDATEDAAIRVLAGARRRVAPHRRYGFLEAYLDRSLNRKTGEARVGLPHRAAVIPGGATPSSRLAITQTIRRKRASAFDVYGLGSAKGAKVIYPSKYAHLVEFGHQRGAGHAAAPPSPFMIPAAEAERTSFQRGCMDAGQKIERDMSVSRFL